MPPFPEPDWVSVQPFPFAAARETFAGAGSDAERLAIRYFRRPDGRLVALAAFGPKSQGAPGQVHGGGILTVLDEALGAAAWLAGHPVLTARLTTEFRRSVPLGAQLLVETRITGARHGLVFVEGALLGPDGARYASAEGTFMTLDRDRQTELFGRAAP